MVHGRKSKEPAGPPEVGLRKLPGLALNARVQVLQVAGKKRGDHHHSRTYFTTVQSGRFAGGGNDCRVGEIGGENGRRSVGDIWTVVNGGMLILCHEHD